MCRLRARPAARRADAGAGLPGSRGLHAWRANRVQGQPQCLHLAAARAGLDGRRPAPASANRGDRPRKGGKGPTPEDGGMVQACLTRFASKVAKNVAHYGAFDTTKDA